MKNSIIRFLKDEEGATAIEYGIIAGLMAIVLVAVFGSNGTLSLELTAMFSRIANTLKLAAK